MWATTAWQDVYWLGHFHACLMLVLEAQGQELKCMHITKFCSPSCLYWGTPSLPLLIIEVDFVVVFYINLQPTKI